MHPMLNVAVRAARAAGRIITRASLDIASVKVAEKQRNDFVTEVDRAAEESIISTLRQAYPTHAFLAEESGHSAGNTAQPPKQTPHQADNIWIIDPLDGTTNFIHGLPHYCVSIALMQRGVVTQALVYDPNRDELFTASKGSGAFVNDRRIRVSSRTRIDGSLIGTGFPFRELDDIDRYMTMLKAVSLRAAGVRRPGAAALDLAYVACGRYDGFFEIGLMPWDVAAGSLLVSEAGGLIGDLAGEADCIFSKQVLAATPKVFSQMVTLFATAR
ncbi:MAG: inositol monophosphatase family protein [Burkholderiales bacterium]